MFLIRAGAGQACSIRGMGASPMVSSRAWLSFPIHSSSPQNVNWLQKSQPPQPPTLTVHRHAHKFTKFTFPTSHISLPPHLAFDYDSPSNAPPKTIFHCRCSLCRCRTIGREFDRDAGAVRCAGHPSRGAGSESAGADCGWGRVVCDAGPVIGQYLGGLSDGYR